MKPITEPTEFDRAFLAGLIEAEGHIEITHARFTTKRKTFLLQVTIGNRSENLLEWGRHRFGGFICPNSYRKNGGPKHAQIFRWRMSGPVAAVALAGCIRYMVCKIDQAKIALKLQSTMQKSRTPLTEAIMQKREDCWRCLRELTRTGPRPTRPSIQGIAATRTRRSNAPNQTPGGQLQLIPTLFAK